jgi:hypothetical protein
VLERLAQLLTAKAGDASSLGNALVPRTKPTQKIELMPNENQVGGCQELIELVEEDITDIEDTRT